MDSGRLKPNSYRSRSHVKCNGGVLSSNGQAPSRQTSRSIYIWRKAKPRGWNLIFQEVRG